MLNKVKTTTLTDEYFVVHDTFNKVNFHGVSTKLQTYYTYNIRGVLFPTVMIYTIATVVVQGLMKFPIHLETITD